MMLHAERLGWAAKWFNRLMWLSLVALVIGIVAVIVILISGTPGFRIVNPSTGSRFMTSTEALQAIGGGIGGSLLTAFLWRVGFIVCSFLADFAGGLTAQQIKRERQSQIQ